MKRCLGSLAAILMLLAFIDMALAFAHGIHNTAGNWNIPDGGLGALVLMFLAGLLLTWRERL